VKKTPKLPIRMLISQIVGLNMPQLEGKNVRCNPPTMMTKRSNHMPIFTRMETTNRAATLDRTFLGQSKWGVITLQMTMR